MLLALKYRPKTFYEISGQNATRLVLAKMVEKNKVPSGLLFSGVRGSGKTSAARILGAALNCTAEKQPCGNCASCKAVFSCSGIGVIEIDAASHGGVADIRALTESLQYVSGRLLVIIDEAHSMTKDAFNALLKTLEEPPMSVTFVLVTTSPEKLPDTIQSRLMNFEFRAVAAEEIYERLLFITKEEMIPADLELLTEISQRAAGSVRDAIMTLDQVTRADIFSSAGFQALHGEKDFGPELLTAMLTGNVGAVFNLVETVLATVGSPAVVSDALVATLRDLAVLAAGGDLARTGPALAVRRDLAGLLEPHRAFGALRILWDLRTKTRVGENPRIALDIALVMVTEAVSGKLHREKIVVAKPSLSLEEMDGQL